MLRKLSRKEWVVSHSFILAGLICLSAGVHLSYEQPASNLLIIGLWFSFGGLCWITAYLAAKQK